MKEIIIFVLLSTIAVSVHGQWELLNINVSDEYEVNYRIDFKNEQEGIILKGSSDVFIRTLDGGDSWDTISTGSFILVDYEYMNGDTIVGIGRTNEGSGLYWSYDMGNTWVVELNLIGEEIYSFTISDDYVIFAGKEKIIKYSRLTQDSEEVFYLPDEGYSLIGGVEKLHQASDSVIYASGTAFSEVDSLFKSLILKTEDAGFSWAVIVEKTDFSFISPSLHFWNDTSGLYLSNNEASIHRTDDGGISWNEIELETIGSIKDISFPSDSIGYIVIGEESYGWDYIFYSFSILKTTDMGNSWEYQYIEHPGAPLYSVDFINDSVGYTCGAFDVIMKTTSGGGNISEDYPFEYFIVSTEDNYIENKISIFPNPTSSEVVLKFDDIDLNGMIEIEIVGMDGRTIKVENHEMREGIKIDLTSIPDGVIFFRIRFENNIVVKKVMKI